MAKLGDLPERVRLPDGRVEPFEPERITRSLFAATERVGRADAFLSQEMTDGVLYFLAAEAVGEETTPSDLTEIVRKVVRELGQPAIARAYEERPATGPTLSVPPAVAPTTPSWLTATRDALAVRQSAAEDRLTALSLEHVYPRDLAAAHREGLIHLTDLAAPLELTGLVVSPGSDAWTTVTEARNLAGEFIALDGPEFDLAVQPGDARELTDRFLQDLQRAAQATGLTVILNVNVTDPPRLAQGVGPLFGPAMLDGPRRREIAEVLARNTTGPVVVYWHVADAVQTVPAGPNVEYMFHRPRLPVPLGPGLDRATPTVLTRVGLNLGRLLEQLGGAPVDPTVFLKKVGSLTRFAKTAGHVRQDFLRKHGRNGLREAFLLDRARLVLEPIGLAAAAGASERPPAEFAHDILKAVRTAAETDRPRVLPIRVEISPDQEDRLLSGTTPRQKLKSASALHAVCGGGSLTLKRPALAEAESLIRSAYESGLSRLRFCEDS
jgi:hypothetical protein